MKKVIVKKLSEIRIALSFGMDLQHFWEFLGFNFSKKREIETYVILGKKCNIVTYTEYTT